MRVRRGLAALAAVAAIGLLTGCDQDGDGLDDETGQPVATFGSDHSGSSGNDGCEGWGPLSDCGGSKPVPREGGEAESGCPENYTVDFDYDTERVISSNVPLSRSCIDYLNAENGAFNDDLAEVDR